LAGWSDAQFLWLIVGPSVRGFLVRHVKDFSGDQDLRSYEVPTVLLIVIVSDFVSKPIYTTYHRSLLHAETFPPYG
jgi:hypothetical protein